MILFFSGGGSPWIPEIQLKDPYVMLSYWVNVNRKKNRPDSRLRRLIKVRKKRRSKQK